jgi:hypothetical protein
MMATKVNIETATYTKYATILRSLVTAANAAKGAKDYALLTEILDLENRVEKTYVQLVSN